MHRYILFAVVLVLVVIVTHFETKERVAYNAKMHKLELACINKLIKKKIKPEHIKTRNGKCHAEIIVNTGD